MRLHFMAMDDVAPSPAARARRHHMVRIAMLVAGWLLIAVSPLVGVLPGPGGVFVFAAGLSLVLRTSLWAQRRYVLFKRWAPRAGAWCDWGLRRPSQRRRAALARSAAGPRD